MKDKKDLKKVALAALLFSSILPMDGQAEVTDTHETYLAVAKCGAHCGAAPRREIADNTMNSDNYNARNNSYQVGSYGTMNGNGSSNGASHYSRPGMGSYNASSDTNYDRPMNNENRMYRDTQGWSATPPSNSNRPYNDQTQNYSNRQAAPTYDETYRVSAYDIEVYPESSTQSRANQNGYRSYNTANDSYRGEAGLDRSTTDQAQRRAPDARGSMNR